MTIRELSELSAIKIEIEIIKKQINSAEPKMLTGKVKGSESTFPYCERSFMVRGYDPDTYYRKLDRLQKKLQRKLEEYADEYDKILDYLDTVEDSLMRSIMMCKYINGLTWEQTGKEIGYSSRQCKRKHREFFNGS